MAAPTLVATAKGVTSNSYGTRAAAQTYFDGRLDTDKWETAGGANQDKALIMATSRLEQENYRGSKTTTSQRLKWPRWGTYDDNGDSYSQDTVPRPVLEATYEMALALLKNTELLADTGLEGFKEVGVGTGAVAVTPRASFKAGQLPQAVVDVLHNVRIGTSGISAPAVRG